MDVSLGEDGMTAAAFDLLRDWQPVASVAGGEGNYAALLREQWSLLPVAVRRRFSRHLAPAASIAYAGEVLVCRRNWAGRALAQCTRLIGGPLPLSSDCGVAAHVCVTGAAGGRGQHWTRQYGRRNAMPQIINSTKSFGGPTGVEEYLGYGFGIALRMYVEDGALMFASDSLFWRMGRLRIRLPAWLSPGRLTVGHHDAGGGRFAFTLDLTHPWFGELVHQVAMFTDPAEL